MTTESLEQRLREKITTQIPRLGFETRIQAMARESFRPRATEKKSLVRRCAIPAVALIAIGIVLSPKDKPAPQSTAVTTDVIEEATEESALTKIGEPVQQEFQGLKNDAAWTMGLFKKALPSISVDQKEID